ncbi:intraflagellar transport protein 56 isoform X2 [Macrosteles quadrilineatus]|uniref:intraflagellar transport protein 56 isoform X2 n=1 Tax=Macrosteles quadrilineatus TaxID=74068 RepID=UPI0023E108F5|nr:intraflagellar transport protein 56 isoform X2 [Macrosteles quadrilineatus]
MILSRVKPAVGAGSSDQQGSSKQTPSLEDFLQRRDYNGAITILEFDQSSGRGNEMTNYWLGYCAFHLGDHQRALTVYQSLPPSDDVAVNLACCYFFLGMYPQSEKILDSAPSSRLKTRLLFHLAHKLGDEKKLMEHHQHLQDVIEDQLSLASIHYLRSHYQEAIDIYKRILLDNREYLALNVYVALCYYKLDYYDVSQEVLAVYLQKYPDSAIAINLKACNHFRLYNGKAAEAEIKTLMDQSSASFSFGHDLIRHNIVVFRGGVAALQVLPPLVDVIPEARLNLVIYHLKQEEYKEAFMLVKDLEPSVPQEYILKGVVNVAIGQETGSREHIKVAQQFFHLVGSSASECDTIPGRQCMASSFFLQRQFDDVMLYLSSIKSYYCNDDAFNFNYAQAKAALGHFKEAEDIFLMVQNEKLHNDYVYISHLARCYIMSGKPQSAWELYLKMETSADSFSLLQGALTRCYTTSEEHSEPTSRNYNLDNEEMG